MDAYHSPTTFHLRSATCLVAGLLLVAAPPAQARQENAVAATAAITPQALSPRGDLTMLLERTIFKVDILTLDVWLEPAVLRHLDSLVKGRSYSDRLADSVAAVVLASHAVDARVHFWRDISFEQFLDAVEEDQEKTLAAGLITPEGFREVVEGLPVWFGFLAGLGPRRGDAITYRIRGDTLHTVYRRGAGETEYDGTLIGPQHRAGVLGPYFAPKTSFRRKLVGSIFGR